MTMLFKPMLAAKAPDSPSDIQLPAFVSPKLDGIRAVVSDGQLYSRNGKLIPNLHVRETLKGLPDGFDGELIVGARAGANVFKRAASGIMSRDGTPDFTYYVFDWFKPGCGGFSRRLYHVSQWLGEHDPDGELPVDCLEHELKTSNAGVVEYEKDMVERGYEGIMIRDPDGAYKQGRSTVKEGGLLKWKRWNDAEAVIVGAVERFHNANEAKRNAVGKTERSSAKEGKVPMDQLGAFACAMRVDGKTVEFEVGTGFTDAERAEYWRNKEALYGKTLTFRYQELTADAIPRFPVFTHIRPDGA